MRAFKILPAITLLAAGVPIAAQTDAPRATLVRAAFSTTAKPQAMSLINGALGSLETALTKSPGNRDVLLQQGIGLGYRGQLTQSVGDAKRAREILGGLARRYADDPETQIAFAGWHCSVIGEVGSFIGGTVLGAKRDICNKTLARAVSLGGNRAFFPAYAGLMRIRLDANDKGALALLDRASAGQAPAEVDRITQASARRVAALLRAGNAKGASALAKQLLPFGRIK